MLVPFERQTLPDEYRRYYRTKRNNFFASIQSFRPLWDYYLMLDEIWFRELDVLKPSDPNKSFPVIIYMNAHAKVRVALELAFTGCLPEGRSIMRDAVEFVAHAHHMLKHPSLQLVWLNKLGDKDAWNKEYWFNKPTVLFDGLNELYEMWQKLSEIGAHANPTSIYERVQVLDRDGAREFRLSYTGLAEKPWAMGIFDMLLVDYRMEDTFFKDYETRLQFDETLLNRRKKFEVLKEQIRKRLMAHYGIKPPEMPLIVSG